MNKYFKVFVMFLFFIFMYSSLFAQNTEEFNLTMFYPSPAGSYDVMHVRRLTVGSTKQTMIPNDGDIEIAGKINATSISSSNLEVKGNLTVPGTIKATNVYASNEVRAPFSDLAEWIKSEENVEAGDVVFVNEKGIISKSDKAYKPKVVVISEKPGFLLGSNEEKSSSLKMMALAGQVSCKVTDENGKIKPGDLLVSSSKPGYAMKLQSVDASVIESNNRSLAVFGVALEALEEKEGKIKVLLN